jgi:hypothetical protein
MGRWTIACVAGAAVLLSACQVNLVTRLEASGAGSLTTEVGLTPDEVSQLQSFSGDGTEGSVCASLEQQLQGQANAPAFQEEKRGEDTWCVSTQAFEDPSGLEALYRQMDGVTIHELVLREGIFVYDVGVDAGGSDGTPGPATMSWVVELPGKIGDHNADGVDGQRLTWNLAPGDARTLRASSDLYGLRLPAGWDDALGRLPAFIGAGIACLCCGGVLVVVIVGLVLLVRRKT